MLSLVRTAPTDSRNDTATTKRSFDESLKQWQKHQHQGHQYHQHKRYHESINHFKASQEVGWHLVATYGQWQDSQDRWEMLFQATHNLAACYNASGQNQSGTKALTELHQYLTYTISNSTKERSQRLEALAILDRVLFSLASQLAYENQVTEIHKLIRLTEQVAEHASRQLLSQSQ